MLQQELEICIYICAYNVHTMCVQTKREMDAAEPKSGSCRFANLNKGLALQTSKECYRF